LIDSIVRQRLAARNSFPQPAYLNYLVPRSNRLQSKQLLDHVDGQDNRLLHWLICSPITFRQS